MNKSGKFILLLILSTYLSLILLDLHFQYVHVMLNIIISPILHGNWLGTKPLLCWIKKCYQGQGNIYYLFKLISTTRHFNGNGVFWLIINLKQDRRALLVWYNSFSDFDNSTDEEWPTNTLASSIINYSK